MKQKKPIPVIDIFAGPGGLGEGFSAFSGPDFPGFQIAVSIEKDPIARRTLLLRTFLREFPNNRFPEAYYEFLRNSDESEERRLMQLFSQFPEEAALAGRKAMRAELGVDDPVRINDAINSALGGSQECVLIGGPPCQAYSLVGRSRNRGIKDYVPRKDKKQFLYKEYLQVIADHAPAVFVMENVKGLLSATVDNQHIFNRILEDLQNPVQALNREEHKAARAGYKSPRYYIHSLVKSADNEAHLPSDFVVRMEKHGIPQARHRLILLGIREDLGRVQPRRLVEQSVIAARDVINGLPPLRSRLSGGLDSDEAWIETLKKSLEKRWFSASRNKAGDEVYDLMLKTIRNLRLPRMGRGGEFIPCAPHIAYRSNWYLDKKLDGICNHSSRFHMREDLFRYLYVSCFGAIHNKSPNMGDFPVDLLPKHANVQKALEGRNFSDRFRVQLGKTPATTVTSHISKDGHYYIHPDPSQCRSLTVREAARLQTFPDNYFFCGLRTSQYIQVGNAVPPLLSYQIAKIVSGVLKDAGID